MVGRIFECVSGILRPKGDFVNIQNMVKDPEIEGYRRPNAQTKPLYLTHSMELTRMLKKIIYVQLGGGG